MSDRLKVMLTTEGTYPFHQGGVSTWCDILIKTLPEVDFVIYSIIMNPFVSQKFPLPSNASLIKVPLWGTEEPSEHLERPFSQVFLAKKFTTEQVVRERFLPLFTDLIDEFAAIDKDPQKLGAIMAEMYKLFETYEYKICFKSEVTWEAFKERILTIASIPGNRISIPTIQAMVLSLGWVYRFLNIVNTPLPKIHVSHSAAAAFCGIPCVLAKVVNGVPYLLTEHGVYLREQYLALNSRNYPSYLSTFLMRMINSVAQLSYYYADQVSPVCRYNTRWERRLGVDESKIRVIYNGVDKKLFSPKPKEDDGTVTVAMVARIDPIKDMITMMKASAIIKPQAPHVRFVVFGSVAVPDYYEECLELRKQLNIEDVFQFAGHTSTPATAYQSGDIVALSSISEGFPYSVVEAMMCSKPVVATDVGGIREALGDTGLTVNPKQPEKLAAALLILINNPELRKSMGEKARERALAEFTLEKVRESHLKSYLTLTMSQIKVAPDLPARHRRQGILFQRGQAYLWSGFLREACEQFNNALIEEPNSPAVPVILASLAEAYGQLGETQRARFELGKATLIGAQGRGYRSALG